MSASQTVSRPAGVSSSAVGGSRIMLFRGLTVVGAVLMLISWFMPWWMAKIDALHDATISIRPWGLEHTLGPDMAQMVANAGMPDFFAPMMWAYLIACMVVLGVSLVLTEKVIPLAKFKLSLPQVLVALVGLSYIIALVVAVVYASDRMNTPAFYNMNFIGHTKIVLDVEMAQGGADADLLPGYWLAWVAGVFLVVVGLLRSKIVGSKPA